MRIFMALADSPNPSLASSLWKINLHDPLVELGHDVVLWDGGILPLFDLDPGAPETAPVRAEFSARFLDAVRAAHAARPLDLVITYTSDSHLEPEAIRTVRETVAPIASYFCNNTHQFHLVRRTAPAFTVCLVPELDALDHYRNAGAEPILFPMAANPRYYRPVDQPLAWDVTFAGQRYADRASLILALREAGIDAHAFGPSWQSPGDPATSPGAGRRSGALHSLVEFGTLAARGRSPARMVRDRLDRERLRARHPQALHGPLSDDDYVALFSTSRISLGFQIVGDSHRTSRPQMQVRLREFEGPMAGAFYVTGWMEEVERYYEVGREIVCYRSTAELVDRCRWYLAHDDERERIRRAGHQRALRDHTWTRRFLDLFDELKRRGVLSREALASR